MIPTYFVKQPWEERYCVFDLDDTLITGDTIDNISGITVWDGAVDMSATMVGVTAVDAITRRKVTAIIKGGTAGKTYWIRIRVVAASGDKVEDDLKLICKEFGG
jgi:hypothetical protein